MTAKMSLYSVDAMCTYFCFRFESRLQIVCVCVFKGGAAKRANIGIRFRGLGICQHVSEPRMATLCHLAANDIATHVICTHEFNSNSRYAYTLFRCIRWSIA